ncbi:MAG: hypothetical protein ACTSO2_18895 [Promethearchaeota archaeon]
MTGTYIIRHLGNLILYNSYISYEFSIIEWIGILIIASFLLNLIFSILLKMFFRKYKRERNKLRFSVKYLICTLIISGILCLLVLLYYCDNEVDYFIDLTNNTGFSLSMLGNFVLFFGIAIDMRLLDSIYNIAPKISKNQKLEDSLRPSQ